MRNVEPILPRLSVAATVIAPIRLAVAPCALPDPEPKQMGLLVAATIVAPVLSVVNPRILLGPIKTGDDVGRLHRYCPGSL